VFCVVVILFWGVIGIFCTLTLLDIGLPVLLSLERRNEAQNGYLIWILVFNPFFLFFFGTGGIWWCSVDVKSPEGLVSVIFYSDFNEF
jgi:hypothetical protein